MGPSLLSTDSLSSIQRKYQLGIVKADVLSPLLRLLQSPCLPSFRSAAACVRHLFIYPMNETPIMEAGFLPPLVNLLAFERSPVPC